MAAWSRDRVPLRPVNPESLARPRGYNHGMRGAGELLFVAGQVGWDGEGRFPASDLVGQFAQALDNVLEVVRGAGGGPESVARMVVYLTDKAEYLRRPQELGAVGRARLGRHFPAMAVVEVKSLLEDGALVEIEAVAVL
jgi:enamine deaminase RidA (YjgF/YER057c/UK114 family)